MPNKLQPAAAVPKTNRDIIAATTDLPTTPVPVPKTVEKDAPRVPQQTTVALLPTDIPVIKGSQHPVSVAKELLSQSTTLGPATASVPSSGGNKAAPVDLMRLVEKSADSVHTLWLSIMRTYRMPRSYTTEHISDSKLLLRYIAVHWQRLGHRMLRDAHSPETDKGMVIFDSSLPSRICPRFSVPAHLV